MRFSAAASVVVALWLVSGCSDDATNADPPSGAAAESPSRTQAPPEPTTDAVVSDSAALTTEAEATPALAGGMLAYPGVGATALMFTDNHVWWEDAEFVLNGMPLDSLIGESVSAGDTVGEALPEAAVRVQVGEDWTYPVTRVADADSLWMLHTLDRRLARFDVESLMSGEVTEPTAEMDLEFDGVWFEYVDGMLWVSGRDKEDGVYRVVGIDPQTLETDINLAFPYEQTPGATVPTLFATDLLLGVLGEEELLLIDADGEDVARRISLDEIHAQEEQPLKDYQPFFLGDGRVALAGSQPNFEPVRLVTVLDPDSLAVLGQIPALNQMGPKVETTERQPIPDFEGGASASLERETLQALTFPDEYGPDARIEAVNMATGTDMPVNAVGLLLAEPSAVAQGRVWWGDSASLLSMPLP